MTALLPRERDRLAECEQIIERGLDTFRQVGAALLEIRDSRLYRQTHATFDDYCRQRWSLSARHANRTIEAAEVADVMGPIGPTNEAQARELAPLRDDPEALREVWSDAVERTAGKPTAAALRQARDEREAREEQRPSEANHDQTRQALAGLAKDGLTLANGAELAELVGELDEHFAVHDAARHLVRENVLDVPPAWWKPTPPMGRGSPHSAAKTRLRAEKDRLGVWEIQVMYEAGKFLNWCDKAGITLGGNGEPVRFADQLRYPLDHVDLDELPEGFTEDDEHHAALGEFYTWLLTPDELREACRIEEEQPA